MKKIINKILKRMGFIVTPIEHVHAAADRFVRNYRDGSPDYQPDIAEVENPLRDYFQSHLEGPGIWKWEHYFSIYQRHFGKFVGRRVTILEIGIYSGGSLGMWKSYFGKDCQVIGVDIDEACRCYENEYTKVFIGDQESREFWREFRKQVDHVDIIIDDGGHAPEQQRVTLEEMLPYLSPGGVYLCEDVHGRNNDFSKYASRLLRDLNHHKVVPDLPCRSDVSPFQQSIESLSFYPYCLVIEKNITKPLCLSSTKRGTEWQPFFDRNAG